MGRTDKIKSVVAPASIGRRLERRLKIADWPTRNHSWRLPAIVALSLMPLGSIAQIPERLPGQRIADPSKAEAVRAEERQSVAPPSPQGIQMKHEIGTALRPPVMERPGVVRTAPERIWSALILASDNERPHQLSPELAHIGRKVEQFFGYKQIELIGSASQVIDDRFEQWLVPSQDFWLAVKSKREPGGSYLIDLKVFHDQRHILESQVKLMPNSPLLIRGPMCSHGQLVIALQVQQ